MAQDTSTIVRPNLLVNDAAQYLETRAREAMGTELAGLGDPQYEPMRDRFTPKILLSNQDYYTRSQAKLKELHAILAKFSATLKTRGFDNEMKIDLKNPDSYKMEDVLAISGAIEKRYRDSQNVKNAMGVIRKCFRRAGEQHGQLRRLLACVPTDTYGTVISGGFTIILGALERADNLRTDIYDCLAKIPSKLIEVQELTDVHYHSDRLQIHADTVFVAVFAVIERIVNELTRTMAKKGISLLFKGDRHGIDITEAIKDMETSLDDFRTEVRICSQQKFGRMDQKVTRGMLASESSEQKITKVAEELADLKEQLKNFNRRSKDDQEVLPQIEARYAQISQQLLSDESSEELEILRQIMLTTDVYNQFYFLFTASPIFDPKTGKVDRQRAISHIAERKSLAAKRNHKVILSWLKRFQPVQYTVDHDLKEVLEGVGTMDAFEVDKMQFILTSDVLYHWLQKPRSSIISVDCETFPEDATNSITYTMAYLTKILKEKSIPTIAFFCGLQAHKSMNERRSGPLALLKSLFVQLLLELQEKRPEFNIAQHIKVAKDSRELEDAQTLIKYMQRLQARLPQPKCIYILIDSAVHLTGSERESNEVLRLLLSLTSEPGSLIKIIITNICSAVPLRRIDHESLYIPDAVPGGGQGIDPSFLEENMLKSIESLNLSGSDEDEELLESSDNEGVSLAKFGW